MQKNITKSKEIESTSMGVIYLCGLALGAFKNISEIRRLYKQEKTYLPKIKPEKVQEIYDKWKNAVNQTL